MRRPTKLMAVRRWAARTKAANKKRTDELTSRAKKRDKQVKKLIKKAAKPGQTSSSYYRRLKRKYRDFVKKYATKKAAKAIMEELDRNDDIINAQDERQAEQERN